MTEPQRGEQVAKGFTLFVVDDNPGYLATIAMVVEATPGARLAGSALSAEEALDDPALMAADVALVDYQLPGDSGLQLAAKLGKRKAGPSVVLLMSSYDRHELPTTERDWQFVDGFVPKEQVSPASLQGNWYSFAAREARTKGGIDRHR